MADCLCHRAGHGNGIRAYDTEAGERAIQRLRLIDRVLSADHGFRA
jgi:hypothetical protein